MSKKDKVELLWEKFSQYKETAEQHQFMQLLLWDAMITPAYNDLQQNWNEDHADHFINGVENIVFKRLGIKL